MGSFHYQSGNSQRNLIHVFSISPVLVNINGIILRSAIAA